MSYVNFHCNYADDNGRVYTRLPGITYVLSRHRSMQKVVTCIVKNTKRYHVALVVFLAGNLYNTLYKQYT